MAIFSGRIEDAHYINEKYDTIEILFKSEDPEDTRFHKHIIEADPKSKDFKDLQSEGWSDQKLLDATAEFKRQHSATFNNAVQIRASQIARDMIGIHSLQREKQALDEKVAKVRDDIDRHHGWLEEKRTLIKKSDEKIDEQQEELAYTESKIKKTEFTVDNALLEVLWNHNEKGDELFKFKLWALEQDFVKSAPKEIKSKIRRVKRITEGIALLDSLIESTE
jgi:hypothetical protein